MSIDVMLWLVSLAVLSADGGTLRTSAEIVVDAKARRRAGDYDGALAELSTCLEIDRRDVECMAMLGSVLATRGSVLRSEEDNEQAMLAYQRFLEYAPPNHPFVPRVTAIVGTAERRPDYPVVPTHKARPFIPASKHDYMPPRVTVKLKGTVSVPVATLLQLTNDAPDVADAALSDPATLKVRGLKRGIANLRLSLADGGWHALRVEVK